MTLALNVFWLMTDAIIMLHLQSEALPGLPGLLGGGGWEELHQRPVLHQATHHRDLKYSV